MRNILFKLIILSNVFAFLCTVSCVKQTETNNQLLNSNNKGIYGKLLVFNEYGEIQSTSSGISITAHCVDTLSYDSFKNPILFDTTYKSTPDEFGFYSIKDCHRGTYSLLFVKNNSDTNKIIGFSHASASCDSLDPVYLSKPPVASIKLLSAEVSKNNLLLSIKRVITLTGSSTNEYGVVTRYFFSNSPNVSNILYNYQWISGATYGKTGYTDTVLVQKSTDIFSSSSLGLDVSKPIYIRAYLDNIHCYAYKNKSTDKLMVFPNVTSPSEVIHIDSIHVAE